jgi:hypothetical protein
MRVKDQISTMFDAWLALRTVKPRKNDMCRAKKYEILKGLAFYRS